MSPPPKVFGIGFHKTATTSLKRALEDLGYRVTGPNGRNDPDPAATALDMCRNLSRQFDAFQDNPWPLFYREMDELHPSSKFVLTVRPAEEWIRSVTTHFGERDTPMRQWIYGVGHPAGHEATYVGRYERHNREVVEYFAERPDDLVVMRITEGDGWPVLCPFLGLEPPPTPFPRVNSIDSRRREAKLGRRIVKKLRKAGRRRGGEAASQ